MSLPDLPRDNAGLTEKMRARLKLRRARTLEEALAEAGRRVPKQVRAAGRALVEAEKGWANPKLRRQLDLPRLAADRAKLVGWLEAQGRAERRKDMALGILATITFNLLVLAAALIGWLAWTGRL